MNTLTFNETTLNPVTQNDGQIWLTSSELSKALGYADNRSVTKIYQKYSDEFTQKMTIVINTAVKGFGNGNSKKAVRIFSLRGCHIIAMFARTDIAKQFRKWVLDILDKEVSTSVQKDQIETISTAQQNVIRQAVAKKCKSVSAHYQTIYTKLYDHFNIPRYTELLSVDFDDAIQFIKTIDFNTQNTVDDSAYKINSYALSVHMMRCKQWFDSVRAPLESLNPEITRRIAGQFDEGATTAKQINRSLCNM